VNLGAQPTLAATDGRLFVPFLRAPALCRWARTMVESIIAYSLSASLARWSKTRFHTSPSQAAEPGVHHAEVAKPFRQVTPRSPGAETVQDRIDKQTVIHSWTADRTTPARQNASIQFH